MNESKEKSKAARSAAKAAATATAKTTAKTAARIAALFRADSKALESAIDASSTMGSDRDVRAADDQARRSGHAMNAAAKAADDASDALAQLGGGGFWRRMFQKIAGKKR